VSEQPLQTLRGRVLSPQVDPGRFELLPDALLTLEADGRIRAVEPAPADCPVPETHPGAVWLPGFVDTHVHFPQTRKLGSASGPLLTWLERTVFPEESRFRERAYAEQVAVEFCDALVAQGTTCAAIFSSSHPEATDALFAELSRRGLRALTGLTLMDRGAPAAVLHEAPAALDACAALIERWHEHDGGRLRFCVTPRFALSCTSELMRGAARLAERHGLWIQTHLSENPEELRATAGAFPASADYLGVYEDHGLVGGRTLLAHCIHLSDGEWDRLARRGASVAHCPDSNFFLGSGCMPLRKATGRGVRVGLGSDVGAGRTFSLRRVAASAYDAALLVQAPVPPEELLWRATTGGALALGLGERVGRIAPGYEADLVAVDVPAHVGTEGLIDALLFRHDAGAVRATYVRGKRLDALRPA
jgi:guanine deaminase